MENVFNHCLLDCAFCGKGVASRREEIMQEKTDGARLCRSCFELVLKKAAQTPEHGKLANVSLTWLERSAQDAPQER